MTTDETVTGRAIIKSVAEDAYYVTDGTIVATVATQGGSRLELRMNEDTARRLAEQIQEQVRLLGKYRDETGPAVRVEDSQDIISALAEAPISAPPDR
jgi:hypothetical protein